MNREELMAEAKRRGIVPGARIKCAYDGSEGTVADHSVWSVQEEGTFAEAGLLRVGRCDNGSVLYARSGYFDRWATVITPSEGLTDGMACEPDEHMRKAIVEKAVELGLTVEAPIPTVHGFPCIAWVGSAFVDRRTKSKTIHQDHTWITPGEFYDRLCAMKPKEQPIMINGLEVKWDDNGNASWNLVFFPAETIARMYEASRKRIDGLTP